MIMSHSPSPVLPPLPLPLPPALHHLRSLILQKYMEAALQDSPIDLSIKQERPSSASTGSHSPRSDLSLGRESEDEVLEVDVVEEEQHKPRMKAKFTAKRLLPCETCGKKFDRPSLLERGPMPVTSVIKSFPPAPVSTHTGGSTRGRNH